MTYLQRAIDDGHIRLSGDGKQQRVTYVAVNHTERYADAEEKVRAELYGELVYKYGYAVERIGVEVTVPDRTPKDAADLVVFGDDQRKRPFAVIECARDGISDAEFTQKVEQVCGNGTWAKFRAAYVGVVAGSTRRWLDFSEKYGVLDREANIVADLPREYGKPEEFKYRRGGGNGFDDIKRVGKGDLLAALAKCHQTLWGGRASIASGGLRRVLQDHLREGPG